MNADNLSKEGQITVLGKVDNVALSARALVTVTPGEGADPTDPADPDNPDADNSTQNGNESKIPLGVWIGAGIAVAVIAAGIVIFVVITVKKKKS